MRGENEKVAAAINDCGWRKIGGNLDHNPIDVIARCVVTSVSPSMRLCVACLYYRALVFVPCRYYVAARPPVDSN